MYLDQDEMTKIIDGIIPYIKICRFDHWVKNIFILPGFLIALLLGTGDTRVLVEDNLATYLINLVMIVIATGFIASANYTINEYLDRDYDKLHPSKKTRPGAQGQLKFKWVLSQYIILIIIGLLLSIKLGVFAVKIQIILLVMGFIYNVPPIRSKDKPFVDVITESINNPIRFILGWIVVINHTLPPSSILFCYWMGGAYLMAIKRFSELRSIQDKKIAGLYRNSFKFYNEKWLLVSAIFYAVNASFFLGIFLIKYRIEYVLIFPLVALLFADYLRISYVSNSSAQAPETLYKEKSLIVISIVITIAFIYLTFNDIKSIHLLLNPIKFM